MWPFKRRELANTGNFSADHFATRALPRVTVAEHRAAIARINYAQQQHRLVDFGDGSPQRFNTSTISFNDMVAAQGYTFTIDGYDRWGWPSGHPDSPAQHLNSPQT